MGRQTNYNWELVLLGNLDSYPYQLHIHSVLWCTKWGSYITSLALNKIRQQEWKWVRCSKAPAEQLWLYSHGKNLGLWRPNAEMLHSFTLLDVTTVQWYVVSNSTSRSTSTILWTPLTQHRIQMCSCETSNSDVRHFLYKCYWFPVQVSDYI